jgi:hypothetical protein
MREFHQHNLTDLWSRKMSFKRLSIVGLVLCLPVQIMADHHFDAEKKDSISAADDQLAAQLTEFLKQYARVYNDQDYRSLKSMWHQDGNPIYMAEEVPFPLYGQDRLNNYLNPVPGKKILEGIDNRYSKVRAKYVAPDVAVATYRLDYDIKLVGMPAQHGWDRVMAVFVRVDDSWKLTAYTEAPMGPATMVRKMMKAKPATNEKEKADYATTKNTIRSLTQGSVNADFDEFLKARKDVVPIY